MMCYNVTSFNNGEIEMQSYLRVKIKSLAEEARIIKLEERKAKWRRRALQACQKPADKVLGEYFGLYHHRTYDVRNEARAAQLAYAFIRQMPYERVENPELTKKPVNLGRVAQLVSKYATKTTPDNVSAWLGAKYEPLIVK
jgi:hypothetical protein